MSNNKIFYDVYNQIGHIADRLGVMLEGCMKNDIYMIESNLKFVKVCIAKLEENYITPLSDEVAYINNINRNEMTEQEERDYNYLIKAYKNIKLLKLDKINHVTPRKNKLSVKEKLSNRMAINNYKNIAKFSEAQMKRLEV